MTSEPAKSGSSVEASDIESDNQADVDTDQEDMLDDEEWEETFEDSGDESSESDSSIDQDFWGGRVTKGVKASQSSEPSLSEGSSQPNIPEGEPSLGEVDRSEVDAEQKYVKKYIQPDRIDWNDDYTKLDDVYSKSYVLGSWPHETRPHFMQSLWENSSLTYDLSLHFNNHNRTEAVSVLAERQETLEDKAAGEFADYIPNTEAINETLGVIKDMKRRVENEGEPFVSVSIVLTIYAASEEALERSDRSIRELLEVEAGFSAIAPTKIPERALVSSSPLATDLVSPMREESGQPMLGTAAAHTFPFINDTVIEEGGVLMGKNLADETPVLLDIYNRNNGYNKLVIGDIGSGKSFSEGQYLIRHRMANPEDNIIIIDPMGGYVGVNKAIGGDRIVINGNETINPLQISKTPDDLLRQKGDQLNPYRMKLEDVRWFFNRFFQQQNSTIGSDQWAVLDRAIRQAYRSKGITPDPQTHGNPSPTIHDIMKILGEIAENPRDYADTTSGEEIEFWETNASYLLMSLEPFREGNEMDNLVGETDLHIDSNSPTYIDMQQMDGREDLGLIMKIVFSLIYEEIKESECRTIVAIDEAHKIIGDEQAADHWQEIFRHSRHHEASIHLLSQEFEDFFGTEDSTEDRVNEAAKTMANQCTVRRIQRVNNVNRKLAKDAIDLTDSHIDFIENAVAGEEQRGYTTALLQVDDLGSVGLRIEPTEAEIAAIDYDPTESMDESHDLDSVKSKRIRRAIKVTEGLADPLPTPDEDGLIRDLVSQIDVTNLSKQGIKAFVDELISDNSTQFSPEDREYLIERFNPDEAGMKDDVDDTKEQAQPSDDSTPPWKQQATMGNTGPVTPSPQNGPPEKSIADISTESDRNNQKPSGDQSNSSASTERTSPPPNAAGSVDDSTTQSVEFNQSTADSNTKSSASAVEFNDRIKKHKEAIEQFPEPLLERIATQSPHFESRDTADPATEEFTQTLAEIHAKVEVDMNGPESPPEPTDLPEEHEKIARELHRQAQSADD